MITNKQVRNAFTGALAVMALGLFSSCSESLVAPGDDALEPLAPTTAVGQEKLQSCSLVDGVWVCESSTETTMTTTTEDGGDDGRHCEIIMGVLYCPPGSNGGS